MYEDVLKVIAESVREAAHPDVVAVATFGGGESGLPGLRLEYTNGAKFFLVPDLTDAAERP